MARPSKYQPAFAAQATKLCRLGATDKDLADFFAVSERTLNTWKGQHPEFLQALNAGKSLADAEVADRLYQRALGYQHAEDDIRVCDGVIVTTPTTKHYPPDTVACIFWLKNRRPDLWRDKPDPTNDDTRAGFMDGAEHLVGAEALDHRHSSKLWLCPHLNMAMTQRGDGLLTTTARNLLERALPDSFDDAVRLMLGLLAFAKIDAVESRRQAYGIEDFPGAEVVLVGWSPCNLSFQAMRWRHYPTDTAFIQSRVDKALFLPEIDRLEPVETPDTAEKMEALARRQVAWARREHPNGYFTLIAIRWLSCAANWNTGDIGSRSEHARRWAVAGWNIWPRSGSRLTKRKPRPGTGHQ